MNPIVRLDRWSDALAQRRFPRAFAWLEGRIKAPPKRSTVIFLIVSYPLFGILCMWAVALLVEARLHP